MSSGRHFHWYTFYPSLTIFSLSHHLSPSHTISLPFLFSLLILSLSLPLYLILLLSSSLFILLSLLFIFLSFYSSLSPFYLPLFLSFLSPSPSPMYLPSSPSLYILLSLLTISLYLPFSSSPSLFPSLYLPLSSLLFILHYLLVIVSLSRSLPPSFLLLILITFAPPGFLNSQPSLLLFSRFKSNKELPSTRINTEKELTIRHKCQFSIF